MAQRSFASFSRQRANRDFMRTGSFESEMGFSEQFMRSVQGFSSDSSVNLLPHLAKRTPTTDNVDDLMQMALDLQDEGRFEESARLISRIDKITNAEEEDIQAQLKGYAKSMNIFEESSISHERSDSINTAEIMAAEYSPVEPTPPNSPTKPSQSPEPIQAEPIPVKPQSIPRTASPPPPPPPLNTPSVSPQPDTIHPNSKPAIDPIPFKASASSPKIHPPAVNHSSSLDTFALPAPEIIISPLDRASNTLKPQAKPKTTVPAQSNTSAVPKENLKRMVTKSGHLQIHKQLVKPFPVKQWKIGYFVLSGRFLFHFKSHGSKKCQTVINLTNCDIEPVIVIKKEAEVFELRVREDDADDILRLRLASKRDTLDWYRSIQNNVLVAKTNVDILKRDDITQAVFNPGHATKKLRDEESEFEIIGAFWKTKHFSSSNSPNLAINSDLRYTAEEDEAVYEFYKLLNVSPTASDSTIKKSYRKLARNLHPDKIDPSQPKTQDFSYIARAFDTLKFKSTRKEYDIAESVKLSLRKGVVCKLHQQFADVRSVILFIDPKMLKLVIQAPKHGQILQDGFRELELRFVTHIYCGLDGINKSNEVLKKMMLRDEMDNGSSEKISQMRQMFQDGEEHRALSVSSETSTRILSLHGERLGQQDWHLELHDTESRDILLQGLRKHRCDNSELFKQRLEEMRQRGIR